VFRFRNLGKYESGKLGNCARESLGNWETEPGGAGGTEVRHLLEPGSETFSVRALLSKA
jgi:hypothetical protein